MGEQTPGSPGVAASVDIVKTMRKLMAVMDDSCFSAASSSNEKHARQQLLFQTAYSILLDWGNVSPLIPIYAR